MRPCLPRSIPCHKPALEKSAAAMASVMLDRALHAGTCTAFDLRRAGFTDDDIAALAEDARAHALAEAVRRNLAADLNLDIHAPASEAP